MTYSPSSLSSWLATTEGGPPQIDVDGASPSKKARKKPKKSALPSAGKSRKIRLYPNHQQKAILRQWCAPCPCSHSRRAVVNVVVLRFGIARWIYNQCLALVKADGSLLKKKELRPRVVNNGNYDKEDSLNPWVLKAPYEVRDGAMNDVIEAYKSNFAKVHPP